ncbi:DUF3130 family protein [Enterococcus faecalis]|uniref:DUF3130 family protein n=1 Tax=Enterococcus faecalis TaxID=1351 RepID=UPI0040416EB8
MTKISTDPTVVSDLTSQFSESLSDLTFSPKETIAYSESAAVSGLTSSLSSLATSIGNFSSYASSDVQKLTTIHQAIQKADQEGKSK